MQQSEKTAAESKLLDQSLPFKVEIAESHELLDVARMRAQTYGKYLPELAAKLCQPEFEDFEAGSEVMVARSKLDGSLLGTLRTQSNLLKPLPLESSITLPERFKQSRLVETTRLCIQSSESSSLVRNALFKALHQYCLKQEVDYLLATGRHPVDRIYTGLLFADAIEAGTFYPMAHVGGVPHRVMFTDVARAQQQWHTQQHHLYQFAFETRHVDINLTRAKQLNWANTNSLKDNTVIDLTERRKMLRPIHSEPNRHQQDRQRAA